MTTEEIRSRLKKQLRSANGLWEEIPILLNFAVNSHKSNSEYGRQLATRALVMAKELNDPFWIACSLRTVALYSNVYARYSQDLFYFRKASRIFAQLNDHLMKAKTDVSIARVYMFTGNLPKAAPLLLQHLPLFRDLGLNAWRVRCYRYLGSIYQMAGEFSTSLKYARKGLAISLKEDSPIESAYIYSEIGTTYSLMNDKQRSRAYMTKALLLQKRAKHLPGIAAILRMLSEVYLDEEQFARVERYARHALGIYHRGGNYMEMAISLSHLAAVYTHHRNFPKALGCLKKAMELLHTIQSENDYTLGLLYWETGQCLISMENPVWGVRWLEKSLRLIDRTGYGPAHLTNLLELATVHESIGNTARALFFYKKHQRMTEEYRNSQKLLEAGRSEISVKLRATLRKLKKEQGRNEDLKQQIEQKEAELTAMAFNLVRQEQSRKGSAQKSATAAQSTGSSWETFARQFHKVHYDFYNRILQYRPGLTPTEIKVCSLIRIGLGTKEIADLLCIAKRTVDTHRVRIHKKMNLPQGSSLATHIAGM